MERLSPLDASFLRIETPEAHMHIGWLAELRLPRGIDRLDVGLLRERIGCKLHLTPRFRQRVRDAPVGEPFWADDRRFDLASHIREAAGELDGGAPLSAISAGFFSQQLRRDRPLWEILLIPRTGTGRAAVLGKVHHSMVDGIAAVQLGVLLFDLLPDPERSAAVPWSPSHPSPVRVALGSVTDLALTQFRAARQAAGLGLRPGRALRVADNVRRAAFSLAGELSRPAPESFLAAPLTPGRVLIPARVEMARAKRLAADADAKLNDVILAAVAGALRDLAARLGAQPTPQRALVPINVRGKTEENGNRITFGFVDLPVHLASSDQRLGDVIRQMNALKASGFAAGSDLLLRSTAVLPAPLKAGVARVAASPRTYNLIVSNVPGPKVPLYLAGARVSSVHPVIPISDGHALSIGVVSYDEKLHFGIYADPTALPEADQLEGLIPAELDRMEAARMPSRRLRTRESATVGGVRAGR
jgi:diacylglycerol O-acyltransferase